jgi:hypothetical protein
MRHVLRVGTGEVHSDGDCVIEGSREERMSGTLSIHDFLREAHVPYSVVPHRLAFTAQEEAAAAHVPGRDWAKVVVTYRTR